MEVEPFGGRSSPTAGKRSETIPFSPTVDRQRANDEYEEMARQARKARCPTQYNKTVVAQRARRGGILAKVRSTSGKARKEFVNPHFNSAINSKRCVQLRTRPEELGQSNFVGQPLPLEVYNQTLKPNAAGQSKMTGRFL